MKSVLLFLFVMSVMVLMQGCDPGPDELDVEIANATLTWQDVEGIDEYNVVHVESLAVQSTSENSFEISHFDLVEGNNTFEVCGELDDRTICGNGHYQYEPDEDD